MYEDTLEELQTEPALEIISKHKATWIQHIDRKQENRLQKLISRVGQATSEDLRRAIWTNGTGTGPQVAQLHDRWMMMIPKIAK
jgi:hypothetical protein